MVENSQSKFCRGDDQNATEKADQARLQRIVYFFLVPHITIVTKTSKQRTQFFPETTKQPRSENHMEIIDKKLIKLNFNHISVSSSCDALQLWLIILNKQQNYFSTVTRFLTKIILEDSRNASRTTDQTRLQSHISIFSSCPKNLSRRQFIIKPITALS